MKIIVAHPGKQHSFRVAKALKDAGLLYKYATTVYNKDSSILMRFIKLFLGKDNYARAQRRKCPSLVDEDVIQFCELEGLLLLALIRIDFTHRYSDLFNEYISRKFQRKLAKYIIRNNVDMVISYDTNSTVLFSILKEKAPNVIRVMDNAHPNRHYLYHSYHEHWDCVGPFGDTLTACGYLTNLERAKSFGEEAKLAHYHIVASSYSQKALEFDGIKSYTIFKIPYGVDNNKFVESGRCYDATHLNVLFMGEVNQRKGIRQLLEAAKEINSKEVVFNIVGAGTDYCASLYDPYKTYVNLWGYVSFEELLNQLKNNHIFVFPTMGEGFGLVLLEAMAAGLVPITTRNCGGADIVEDGVNGFLIEVGDTDAIVEKIMWCKSHPEELKVMSQRAIETAHQFTWQKYEENLIISCRGMFQMATQA